MSTDRRTPRPRAAGDPRPEPARGARPAAPEGVRRRARCALAAVVGALVVAGSAPAAALVGEPVTPRPGVVYLSSGTSSSTSLSTGTRTGWSLSFSPSGAATGVPAHQGLAYRASDGMLYAVAPATRNEAARLLTLDSDGSVTRSGALDRLVGHPGAVTGGTFGQGTYADTYLAVVTTTTGARAGSALLAVDIAADGSLSETLRPLDLPAGVRLGDVAPSGGYLWGAHGQEIYRINPADGSATAWTLPEGTVGPGTGTVFGAAWATGDGQLGLGSHEHGEITEIAVTDQASATPTFEVLARHSTPIGQQSDGTFAPAADPAEIPSPGDPDQSPRQPSAPEIDPTDGTRFAGHGVPGHTVTVTFPDASTTQTTVDDDGVWVAQPPDIVFVHGHLVEATATDPAGVTSEPSCTTVDLVPEVPVVEGGADLQPTPTADRGGQR